MKELLYQFNPWWEGSFHSSSVVRPRYLDRLFGSLESKEIVFMVGLRRVGKTTLMHQIIEKLLLNHKPEHVLYVSLDHPLFDETSILDVLKEYRTIHGLPRKERVFLFFDEVHLKEGFERDLKMLYDMENVKVYASGSSSLLLQHKGSFLTGRQRSIMIEPLDFAEFLSFRGVSIKNSEDYLLDKYAEDYLRVGGIPEYVLRGEDGYLRELVENIIYKDIVGRYGIKNPDLLRKLFFMLAERVGSRFTYSKLANVLGLSVDTVKQYAYYLEETFLVYLVSKHASSMNESIYAPKKVYLADNGIRNSFIGFKDLGSLAENQVFLKIKDMGKVSYYFESDREIDFIVNKTAIEVKYKDKITEEDKKTLKDAKAGRKIIVSKSGKHENGLEVVPLAEFLYKEQQA